MVKHVRNTALALALGAALGVMSAPALAGASDSDRLNELQQKLDQSLKMIEALSNRVHELEAHQPAATASAAAPAPAPAPAPAEAQRLDTVEQKVAQIETANASRRGDDTGLPIHGFADVGGGTHNPYNPGLKGANIGELDFYLTPTIGGNVRSLFELNFEVSPGGTVGVDLERAQIGYQFSDQATVWLGRFHTPYGYVNTALHHGLWVAEALRRPKFLQFEDHGGAMPAHTVGAWLTGALRNGDGKLLYDVYAGNGQQIQGGLIDMRNAGNLHGSMMGGGRLGYQFTGGALEGLTLGVHAFTDRIDDDQMPANITRLKVYGGYVVYDTDSWENIVEFYAFNNEDLTGNTGSHRSNAGFGQFAYRAGWGVPYVRYEKAHFDQTDQFFAQQTNVNSGNSYYRSAAGVRFDVNLKSAIKFEFANTHQTDGLVGQYNEVLAQYAIRF